MISVTCLASKTWLNLRAQQKHGAVEPVWPACEASVCACHGLASHLARLRTLVSPRPEVQSLYFIPNFLVVAAFQARGASSSLSGVSALHRMHKGKDKAHGVAC